MVAHRRFHREPWLAGQGDILEDWDEFVTVQSFALKKWGGGSPDELLEATRRAREQLAAIPFEVKLRRWYRMCGPVRQTNTGRTSQ